jgi:hypothetical protein
LDSNTIDVCSTVVDIRDIGSSDFEYIKSHDNSIHYKPYKVLFIINILFTKFCLPTFSSENAM